jgi:Uma2 family endonuclease
MSMPAIRHRWTTAQVRSLMDESRAWPRYELIAGELLVTPAPPGRHQIVVLELAIALDAYLRREPVGIVLTSPADLELQKGTVTQPDVFVVPRDTRLSGETLEWPDIKALLLAVEVLSASSLRADRVEKRDFYLEHGVAEYWVVDADARIVERWTPARETPSIARQELRWMPSAAQAEFALDLPAFFERVDSKLRLFK